VDTGASGDLLYAYTVTATESTGYCTSTYSLCAEASTTGDCLEPPRFSGVAAVTDRHTSNCSLEISWGEPEQVYCGSGARYNVYRSIAPGFDPGPSNQIASCVTGTSYVDASPEPGLASHYVVRAEDNTSGHGGPCGGNEDLNAAELSGVPTGPITIGTWRDDSGDTGVAKLVVSPPWEIATSGGYGMPLVYRTGDYGDRTCAGVATPELSLATGAELSFWTKYDIESDWDKGEVQISTDGGVNWTRVPMSYPRNASYAADSCGLPSGTTYFTGQGLTYAEYTTPLDSWTGQAVLIRWVISSDTAISETGWWIDDIAVANAGVAGSCVAEAGIFSDGFESGDDSAWSETAP
jgi:hypothetical protein